MNNYKVLHVLLEEKKVGTLAMAKNHLVAFEYDNEWLNTGFSISPFSLPLEKGVFLPKGYEPFGGLFGVFADSLPDGWGRLLVDRLFLREHIDPSEVDSLNRLAIVGTTGMGALVYQPELQLNTGMEDMSLDQIAEE
ncbi:MAG: HipA N-terminal domain-containing protein, partial [Acetatifactor sp.]|nr:HipA N-terminal domain-containing protein [Acetatifactor sp.]